MPTTYAYLRISTAAQDEASQRNMITGYASTHGLTISTWLGDTASGSTPWQSRLIAGAISSAKPGDTIIVSEISRIARSTIGVLTCLQAAAAAGITMIAVRSGICLDQSLSAKIVITMLALAAEIERDLLRERTKAALQARKARGLPIGRQPGATGKRHKLDGKWPQIEPLLNASVPVSAIARLCGCSRQTMYTYILDMRFKSGAGTPPAPVD